VAGLKAYSKGENNDKPYGLETGSASPATTKQTDLRETKDRVTQTTKRRTNHKGEEKRIKANQGVAMRSVEKKRKRPSINAAKEVLTERRGETAPDSPRTLQQTALNVRERPERDAESPLPEIGRRENKPKARCRKC